MSSSILERPWSEAGWREIRSSGLKYGISEDSTTSAEAGWRDIRSSGSKYDGISEDSASSGSKSKEENEKPAAGNCSYCLMVGHDHDQCRIRIMIEEAKAKVPPTPKCEICSEAHDIVVCPILAPYKYRPLSPEPRDDSFGTRYSSDYEPDSPTYSETEDEDQEVASTECRICYQEHDGLCSYIDVVPPGARVSPFYYRICKRCDNSPLDDNFYCKNCQRQTLGYVTSRLHCYVCCYSMSPKCCPYGELISRKQIRAPQVEEDGRLELAPGDAII